MLKTPPAIPRFEFTAYLITERFLGAALAATVGQERACLLVKYWDNLVRTPPDACTN